MLGKESDPRQLTCHAAIYQRIERSEKRRGSTGTSWRTHVSMALAGERSQENRETHQREEFCPFRFLQKTRKKSETGNDANWPWKKGYVPIGEWDGAGIHFLPNRIEKSRPIPAGQN